MKTQDSLSVANQQQDELNVGPAAAHAVAVISRAPERERQYLFDLMKSTLDQVPVEFRSAVEARVRQNFSDLR